MVELFNRAQRGWAEDVLNLAAERFERRLVEETSKLRVEMARGFAEVRQEMAGLRADLIKWMFAFWIGQVAVMIGLMAFALRSVGR